MPPQYSQDLGTKPSRFGNENVQYKQEIFPRVGKFGGKICFFLNKNC